MHRSLSFLLNDSWTESVLIVLKGFIYLQNPVCNFKLSSRVSNLLRIFWIDQQKDFESLKVHRAPLGCKLPVFCIFRFLFSPHLMNARIFILMKSSSFEYPLINREMGGLYLTTRIHYLPCPSSRSLRLRETSDKGSFGGGLKGTSLSSSLLRRFCASNKRNCCWCNRFLIKNIFGIVT